MKYVVDSSVAVKWFVEEVHTETAVALLTNTDTELEAPELILAEVANAAWKKVLRDQIAPAQAAIMVDGLPGFLEQLHASADLAADALSIALELRHPVYDCFYLACAQQQDARLATADDRLCRAVADSAYAPLVEHISNSNP